MKNFIAFLITMSIVVLISWNIVKSNEDKYTSNRTTSSTQNNSRRDKYGLLASDYDKNGWAKVNGKWVSNPRAGAAVRYSNSNSTTTRINTNNTNRTTSGKNRNFTSIEETYPILERVARELQYSDIPALRESFKNWKPLSNGSYYIYDGRYFYSQQSLFDYKIQLAKSWGSKNDQNGDGVINCQDYAELFYKYAKRDGYNVRYVSNNRLNHAFNSVNINGKWVSIEPQAAEGGLDKKPYLSNSFPGYNPAYDRVIK